MILDANIPPMQNECLQSGRCTPIGLLSPTEPYTAAYMNPDNVSDVIFVARRYV